MAYQGNFTISHKSPKHATIDPKTRLSPTYQIVVKIDTNYRYYSKQDAQEATAARLEATRIPLSSRYREPISAIIDKETSKWLGFLRIDLQNPQIYGIVLLRITGSLQYS
jgi:hypothetical protein